MGSSTQIRHLLIDSSERGANALFITHPLGDVRRREDGVSF